MGDEIRYEREAEKTNKKAAIRAADKMIRAKDKQPRKRMEAHGVMGLQSKPWRKEFASSEAFNKWKDKHEGNVEVHATRDLEDSLRVQGDFIQKAGKKGMKWKHHQVHIPGMIETTESKPQPTGYDMMSDSALKEYHSRVTMGSRTADPQLLREMCKRGFH